MLVGITFNESLFSASEKYSPFAILPKEVVGDEMTLRSGWWNQIKLNLLAFLLGSRRHLIPLIKILNAIETSLTPSLFCPKTKEQQHSILHFLPPFPNKKDIHGLTNRATRTTFSTPSSGCRQWNGKNESKHVSTHNKNIIQRPLLLAVNRMSVCKMWPRHQTTVHSFVWWARAGAGHVPWWTKISRALWVLWVDEIAKSTRDYQRKREQWNQIKLSQYRRTRWTRTF